MRLILTRTSTVMEVHYDIGSIWSHDGTILNNDKKEKIGIEENGQKIDLVEKW